MFVCLIEIWFFGRDTSLNTFHVFHTVCVLACMHVFIKKSHLYLSFTWNFNANTIKAQFNAFTFIDWCMFYLFFFCFKFFGLHLEKSQYFQFDEKKNHQNFNKTILYTIENCNSICLIWNHLILFVFFLVLLLKCQLELAATKTRIYKWMKIYVVLIK